jgi:hypothetical protein
MSAFTDKPNLSLITGKVDHITVQCIQLWLSHASVSTTENSPLLAVGGFQAFI